MAELSTWESRRPFIGERIFSTGVPKQSATKPIIWPRRTLSPTAATAEYRPERFAYIHYMLSYICGRPTGAVAPLSVPKRRRTFISPARWRRTFSLAVAVPVCTSAEGMPMFS